MTKSPIGCSILVSTYNWPRALDLALQSLLSQTIAPDEIVIADDGSTDETKRLIRQIAHKSPIPIKHIWHADEGFRAAEIRNKAIAATTFDYIIQIDGDCIPHPSFVSDHMEVATVGEFVCGSRVRLDKRRTQKVLNGGLSQLYRMPLSMEQYIATLRLRPLMHYLAPRFARHNLMRHRGCNMAFWRNDLVKVNGYNADFRGWGLEETDLVFRLSNAGVKKRALKLGGILFHLYHPERNRSAVERNQMLADCSKHKGIAYTPNGIIPLNRGNSNIDTEELSDGDPQ